MIIYIAGPMTGYPKHNFPAFYEAEAVLDSKGYDTINPARMDEACGYDPATEPTPEFLQDAIRRDFEAICRAEGLALLPGWERSVGATAEAAIAKWRGIPVYLYPSMVLLEEPESAETRITDPLTGGQKGSKLERFDLIPPEPLEELARVYGMGALKYEDNNWQKGYAWKLSFAAMMRHAWAFWRGEDKDPESGCKHLAHCAWHCMTMMWFMDHHKAGDSRKPNQAGSK